MSNLVASAIVRIESGNAIGTGFFLRDRRTVITNHHVVAGRSVVDVRTSSGRVLAGSVVQTDAANDLAEVRVMESSGTAAFRLDSVANVKIGDRVSQVGWEGGTTLSRISGTAATHDSALMRRSHRPGMSGCPVFSNGRVVGVHFGDQNTANRSRSLFCTGRILLEFLHKRKVNPPPPKQSQDVSVLLDRIQQLEQRLSDLKRTPGPPGRDGKDGKDGARGPPGKDGADGKPGTVDVVVTREGKEIKRFTAVASGSTVLIRARDIER